MSEIPLHTSVSAEEDRRFFVITYRTREGDLCTVALGRRGEWGTYRLVSLGLGGRRSLGMRTGGLVSLGLAIRHSYRFNLPVAVTTDQSFLSRYGGLKITPPDLKRH